MRRMNSAVVALVFALGATPGLATDQGPVEDQAVEMISDVLVPVQVAGIWFSCVKPARLCFVTFRPGRVPLPREFGPLHNSKALSVISNVYKRGHSNAMAERRPGQTLG